MLDAGPQQVAAWIAAHWQVAVWLAGALFCATGAALAMLPEAGRQSVSRWMRGEQTDETWATNFTTLFDAIFGQRHLSLRCFATSTLVSLVTVCALWVGLGTLAGLGPRLTSLEKLWQVVLLGLVVNALADYLSLLETRWLLGWLARPRPVWLQALVLLVDLAVTAAIIWGALWAVQALGLTGLILGEGRDGLAEVVGLFSPLTVYFYSSFVTSLWTWGFILSSWLMRGLARLRLLHGVYAEHPGKALSAALGAAALVTGFAGSAGFAALTAPDAQNLSPFDRALCRFAKGEVCLHIRSLTKDEAARLALTLDACRGGITEECLQQGRDIWERDGALAAQYWRTACEAGDATGCTGLGYLHQQGINTLKDSDAAARLYRQGCNGGNASGCVALGDFYYVGIGVKKDPTEAARLYRQGCDGGHAGGCFNLGVLYHEGTHVKRDLEEAARLYRQACSSGLTPGCINLGNLHLTRTGAAKNLEAAAQLYRQACDGGDAVGCTFLGSLHVNRTGVKQDPAAAIALYAQACEMGGAIGCYYHGRTLEDGIGTDPDPDPVAARAAYRKACDLGHDDACARLTAPGD
mgnify:CR=1 FL=1